MNATRHPKLENREWLYEHYWVKEESTPKIAKIIGCSPKVVNLALKRHDIRIRTMSEAKKGMKPTEETKKKLRGRRRSKYEKLNDREWLIQKYWIEELTLTEIKNLVGCPSVDTVWDAMKRQNVVRRSCLTRKNRYPNDLEILVEGILQKIQPEAWKYNGNLEAGVMLGGMIPDFINVNKEKRVIEVFGGRWHSGTLAKENWKRTEFGRKAAYSQLGYEAIILWEEDLKKDNAEEYIKGELKK